MDAAERTQRFEGTVLYPYLDCCGKRWNECQCKKKGKLTIGTGINLDAGISAAENQFLFRNRLDAANEDLNREIPWAAGALNEARYVALWDLCYKMGIGRLLGFQNMLGALRAEQWQRAHDELLYVDIVSKKPNLYWLDVGDGPGGKFDRAEKNAKQLLTWEWVV